MSILRALFPLLLAGAVACSDYTENEQVVKAVDLASAFRGLHPLHRLNSPGGSQSAGKGNPVFRETRLYLVQGKDPLPGGFSGPLASALAAQLSKAGATVRKVDDLPGCHHSPGAKTASADSEGAEVQFSIAGSHGLIVLHYTTVVAEDAIGYLTCEIYEFRKR